MSLVTVLHELVCKDARLLPTNTNEVHLKETDPSATLKKVILALGNAGLTSCVCLDFRINRRASCLSEVLNPNPSPPLRAACDALVCVEDKGVCHLIHIELKSGDDSRAIEQLRNARCFSRFLRELAREWHGIGGLNYREWFVVVTSGRKAVARKRKTAVSHDARPPMERPSNDPSTPAQFAVSDGARIHLGKFFRG